jgi:hypothetical protein
MPVGVPRVPPGLPGAGGIVTKRFCSAPVPSYNVEKPVPLSLTQKGLAIVGLDLS